MQFTLFQWINVILILVLVVLYLRYLYIRYDEKSIKPDEWLFLKKQKLISPELIKLEKKYNDKVRFFCWWFQIQRLKKENIPGVFAEMGVYKGESAVILHSMDSRRELYLFDSFTGFDEKDLKAETGEAATYTTESFADTSLASVRDLFNGNPAVHFVDGHFPESASGFQKPLALLNLDADLYQPTKTALELFYPLISPGGVIFIHDHTSKWTGIIKAVHEFLLTIPESPVFIPDNHGTIVIVKNKN